VTRERAEDELAAVESFSRSGHGRRGDLARVSALPGRGSAARATRHFFPQSSP
jgi:hypothetical protein